MSGLLHSAPTPPSLGWRNAVVDGKHHITPIGDWRGHIESPECWCGPEEREPGLWVHHSVDRREEYEQGRPYE